MTLAEAHRQYQVALENARAQREMASTFVTFEDEAPAAEAELADARTALDLTWLASQ